MTDKELLELAAKAAGIEGDYREGKVSACCFFERTPGIGEYIGRSWPTWNPLTDDGDALRLAVKLFEANEIYELWCQVGDLRAGTEIDFDPYVATRRAIVRAAAEIGKGMA